MMRNHIVLVESNTTGTGRLFAARARALGMEPVLLAADPARYPYANADRIAVLHVDTSDPAAVSAVSGEPAGVVTSSEYFVAVSAEVAACLGRPGPDPDAVRRCRDKPRQRAVLAAAGVPVPHHATAATIEDAGAAADRLGYPVVVKPPCGSGSVGVRLCASRCEVASQAARILSAGTNERGLPVARMVMIEEHVEGPEYSVELFGDAMAAVVAKHLGPAPYFVEIGHDVPAELAGEDQQALTGVARQAIAALELGFGAAHVEMRLTATGPVLIEVNPRLAGGMIPELVHSATGVDLVSAQIAAAIGQTPRLDRGKAAYASLRFLTVDEPGVLVSDRVPAAAAAGVPGVREARLYRARGDRLDPAHDFRDRIGHVWSVASCAQDSRAAAGAGLELLRAAVRPVHDQGVRP